MFNVYMPAGRYYVGDLCYVMHKEWDEVCSLFFRNRNDYGCNEGKFALKDGRKFVSFNTKFGDGLYVDQNYNEYGVDAGLIGCIKIEDIDLKNPQNYTSGGQIIDFASDFGCSSSEGTITIGHIVIETGEVEEDDYEESYYE